MAPSRMVGVSASVNLPLHYEVQKFSSSTGSPGWSWKKGRKTVVVVVVVPIGHMAVVVVVVVIAVLRRFFLEVMERGFGKTNYVMLQC